MSYETGYCRPECNRCSQVCPTGAIRPLTVEAKTAVQIEHAVWNKAYCIPLTDGVSCGNCARHCPSGAIQMVPSDPDDANSLSIPAGPQIFLSVAGVFEHVVKHVRRGVLNALQRLRRGFFLLFQRFFAQLLFFSDPH